jgi:hypothetical protein
MFSSSGSAGNFLQKRNPKLGGATAPITSTVGQPNANGVVRATRPIPRTTESVAKPPAPTPTTQQSGVGSPADLYNVAASQGAAGAGFLANGSPTDFGFGKTYDAAMKNSSDLMAQNADYNDLISKYTQGSIDPTIGANVQSILDKNAANRITDVESLYNAGGQKMNDFQKAQAAARNSAYQSGLFGSKEKASAEASLGANLFRDRAGQIQAANELSRGETQAQLGQVSDSNKAAASLYGNLTGQNLSAAGNFLNAANSASSAGSASDLGFRNMGADVMNQGINNQSAASKYNTDLIQQDYQNQMASWQAKNQATQQMYENAVGKRARAAAKRALEQQQAQLAKMQEGDGWFSKIADPFGVMPY